MPPPNPFRAAIFAPQSLQFGFARMFATISANPDITYRSFRDRGEALGWLASP